MCSCPGTRFSLSSIGQPFSAAHFFWALLQANSCVRQLRAFCFHGSALNIIGFPPIKQPLALEAEALALGDQEKWAEKGDIFHVLLELGNDRRICWGRPGAASSAEQRFKIHRSFRRHATLLEKRRRRMGLESRVASRRDISPSAG